MKPIITVIDEHNADIVTEGGKLEIRNAQDWRESARRYKLGPNGHVWEFDGVDDYHVRYVRVTNGVVTEVLYSPDGNSPDAGCVESQDADVGWIYDGQAFYPGES